jgi:hypothetical protein
LKAVKVLLIEDEVSIRRFLKISLEGATYCPVRAAPAQNWPEFKSTSLLKVTTPAPSAFFSTLELSV